jgi:hypothetical protein
MVASARREKRKEKMLFSMKESFGKKENVVFYASLRTKRREGVFSPSAQKRKMLFSMLRCVRKEGKVFFRLRLKKGNFVHIKAFHIHQ